MAFKKNTMGFSIVELILVIVLIGILASVALAKYVSLLSAGKTATCKLNQMNLRTAQTLYYTQNYIEFHNPHYAEKLEDLKPFMRNEEIPQCPEGYEYQIVGDGMIQCPYPPHQ